MDPKEAGNTLALFSLFHHDITPNLNGTSLLEESHFNALNSAPVCDDQSIIQVILDVVQEATLDCGIGEVGITLTGGFDSRVILAALLFLGIKPVCLTYGNPLNKDIIISKRICKTLGLKHLNAVNQSPTAKSYLEDVKETINIDEGKAHLHRAHRMAAIKEFTKKYKIKVLLTGHFGGEQIRGLSYNNYFSSEIFKCFNEKNTKLKPLIQSILKSYFIKESSYSMNQLEKQIKKLNWMQDDKLKNKLYFLYDLVGMNHHKQDIRLYSKFVKRVVPVYLDERFINTLIRSPHHFARKKTGKLASLSHPKLYCNIIASLYPSLLDIELSNGYKPKDYRKGLIYYAIKRSIKKYILKPHNPPSFSYGQWYHDFVAENSAHIDSAVWTHYDKKAYFEALNNGEHLSNEGYWHKFSNPIFFNLKKKLTE